jgi:tRNA threonylcarbamoyladenosine modification (KEOPS) complex Cgi121 subunit
VNIWLEDFNQHLTVVGFKNVKVKDANKFFQVVRERTENACVQFFDSSLVAGSEHLHFAALNAINAFKGNVNISSSLAMETLLYASAQRQIKEAVRLIGIKPDTNRIAVLILAKTSDQASAILKTVSGLIEGRRDDSVINLTKSKMAGLKRLFKISKVELEAKKERKGAEKQALTDLVIEHMALLVTQR